MVSNIRRIVVQVTYAGSNQLPAVLSAHISNGIDQRIASCEIETMYLPTGLSYDVEVQVTMGAVGVNPIRRFVGIVRDINYKLNPRTVTIQCYGYLKRAAEYENTEDPTFIGGLIPSDLTTGGTVWNQYAPAGYTDTAGNIIGATLAKCNVPYNPNNIQSSTIQYGLFEDAYVWQNGTNSENFDLRETGEQGLSYIERYDEIDGTYTGRYRTFEDYITANGVVRRLMSFPLTSAQPDIPPFTETVDILDGEIQRSVSGTRNYFVATGYDIGGGAGPEYYILQEANPFQPANTKHTAHINSQMIERSYDHGPNSVSVSGTVGPGFPGQSCEAVANALSAELNREIVTGWITTFRDDPIAPLTKILVQGNGGLPDRLGTGQVLYVTGDDITVDETGFTQRLGLLG